MSLLDRLHVIRRSRFLRRTLGTRCAAGFCRNRGLTLNEALHTLGFPVRFPEAG